MKQIKIAALLLMASNSLYAMERRQGQPHNLPSLVLGASPFFCQKCHAINLNIPGFESRDRFKLCGHRCCRFCVCEDREERRGTLRCPVCGAFSNKEDKFCSCIVMGTLTMGVAAMLVANFVYGPHVPK